MQLAVGARPNSSSADPNTELAQQLAQINARLGDWFRRRFEKFNCIARDESASPATGSNAAHKLEQGRLIEQAFA